MNLQNKLYTCSKPGCNFKTNHKIKEGSEFLTEYEYKELFKEDNKISCPINPSNLDCGMKELDPLDYPKPKKEPINKKLMLIIAVFIVVLVVGLIFFFSGKSKPEPKTPVSAPPATETPVVEAPVATPTPAEPVTETVAPEAPAPKAVEEVKPVPSKKAVTNVATPKGTQTKKFPGGGKYVGEMKNGQMQGLGTFYYGQRELISPRDMKKRYAEAGDYLIGEFYEGKVVSGKLYDASNTLKEVIMIGR